MRISDLSPLTTTGQKSNPIRPIGLALLLLTLLVQPGCGQSRHGRQPAPPSARNTESLAVDYLASRYGQPKGDVWEEGKTYFLPDKPELELLRGGAALQGLSVFKASVWSLHTGPEKFPVIVWVKESPGESKVGLMEDAEDVAAEFPGALKSFSFSSPEARGNLALLVGEMVATFDGIRSTGLDVAPEGDCMWVQRAREPKSTGQRIAAACFSESVLEKIILP